MIIELTDKTLHILRHSLGLDDKGNGRAYRNHYCVGPGQDDFDHLQEMCRFGIMKDHGPQSIAGGMHCFTVTLDGKEAEFQNRPPQKKMTRSQKRYRKYLDGDCGLSFGEWLKLKLP